MKQPNIIYVAISKQTGNIVRGARSQTAYCKPAPLARSIGQTGIFRTEYDIYEVNLDTMTKEVLK